MESWACASTKAKAKRPSLTVTLTVSVGQRLLTADTRFTRVIRTFQFSLGSQHDSCTCLEPAHPYTRLSSFTL